MKWIFLIGTLMLMSCGTPQSLDKHTASTLTTTSRSDHEDLALDHLNAGFEHSKQNISPQTKQALSELQAIMQGLRQ